jgi:TIR domain-containing protein
VSAPIFISYSSKDQDIAETICKALESRGNNCWISCRDVAPGENFQEAIVRALRGAKVMLLVFTANANNSDEIKKELVLAGRHQVTVVPVRVEDVVPNDAFSYEFATRQWVDLYKNWEQEIELLSTRLEHVLQNDKPAVQIQSSASSPFRPPQKSSSRQPLIWAALGAAAVVVVGGGVYLMRPAVKPAPMVAATPAPSAPAAQTMAPPPVSPPQQQAAAPSPPPAPAAAPPPPSPPQISPEEAAWQTAETANTVDALRDFEKNFPGSAHTQTAQLRVVDLTLQMPATAGKAFDGTWQTTYTCPAAGSALGFSFQFNSQVKDGVIHGVHGTPGERSSLVLDGKLQSGGDAAMTAKGVVGSATFAVGGQPGGTPYAFHATAHFDRNAGNGHRIEGRPCDLTFTK